MGNLTSQADATVLPAFVLGHYFKSDSETATSAQHDLNYSPLPPTAAIYAIFSLNKGPPALECF